MLRRDVLLAGLSTLAFPALRPARRMLRAAESRPQTEALATIERRVRGRLGVSLLDTGSGRRLEYRAGERFPMCSTFKWLLAAQVLARVDANEEQLARVIPYGAGDLLEYAPVTRARVGEGGMSVADLCDAVVAYSDNTAANLLLNTVGGPAGFTAFLRTIGDDVTRLDRLEPELNTAIPGDPRDTTTPAAMLRDLQTVLLGTRLLPASRDRLLGWLVGNTTGGAKLRAGLPAGWRVGDKTGMGANGSTNDVAIAWPGSRAPILIAAYVTETEAPVADRNGALADVGRVVAEWAGTASR